MINSIEVSRTDHKGSITAHRHEVAREERVAGAGRDWFISKNYSSEY